MLKNFGIILGIASTIICGIFTIICLVQSLWGISAIAALFLFASMYMLTIEISDKEDE
jgi:hypothetical protein